MILFIIVVVWLITEVVFRKKIIKQINAEKIVQIQKNKLIDDNKKSYNKLKSYFEKCPKEELDVFVKIGITNDKYPSENYLMNTFKCLMYQTNINDENDLKSLINIIKDRECIDNTNDEKSHVQSFNGTIITPPWIIYNLINFADFLCKSYLSVMYGFKLLIYNGVAIYTNININNIAYATSDINIDSDINNSSQHATIILGGLFGGYTSMFSMISSLKNKKNIVVPFYPQIHNITTTKMTVYESIEIVYDFIKSHNISKIDAIAWSLGGFALNCLNEINKIENNKTEINTNKLNIDKQLILEPFNDILSLYLAYVIICSDTKTGYKIIKNYTNGTSKLYNIIAVLFFSYYKAACISNHVTLTEIDTEYAICDSENTLVVYSTNDPASCKLFQTKLCNKYTNAKIIYKNGIHGTQIANISKYIKEIGL